MQLHLELVLEPVLVLAVARVLALPQPLVPLLEQHCSNSLTTRKLPRRQGTWTPTTGRS